MTIDRHASYSTVAGSIYRSTASPVYCQRQYVLIGVPPHLLPSIISIGRQLPRSMVAGNIDRHLPQSIVTANIYQYMSPLVYCRSNRSLLWLLSGVWLFFQGGTRLSFSRRPRPRYSSFLFDILLALLA